MGRRVRGAGNEETGLTWADFRYLTLAVYLIRFPLPHPSRLSEPLDVASVSDVPGDGPVVGKREESQPQQPQDVSIMAVVLQKDENVREGGQCRGVGKEKGR